MRNSTYRLLCLILVISVIAFFLLRIPTSSSRPELPSDRLIKGRYGCVQDSPLPAANMRTLVDATAEIRLDFKHQVGPLGSYYMPESVGSGGAIADFNGDGRLDLFLINAGHSPETESSGPPDPITNKLYTMTPSGQFEDVSAGSGLERELYGMGCATGDVDNDGDIDIYVTAVRQDYLFLNQGNMKFTPLTPESGLDNKDWSTGAAFLDYDRDGLLDLIVTNYVSDETYQFSVACGFHKGLVSYCGPHKFQPTIDRLYRNTGLKDVNGTGQPVLCFEEVTDQAGLGSVRTYGLGVTCADFTGDGWIDIFIANDGANNRLWVNQQNATFLDEANYRGVAVNGMGVPEGSMGIAVGDFDHNTALDLIVSHLSSESTTLYLNDGTGVFEDHTRSMGLHDASLRHTGWGTALIDLDHDGALDLPIVNGLVVPCHSGFPFHGEDTFQVRRDSIADDELFWRDYHDRNLLVMGHADHRLVDQTVLRGGDFTRADGSGRSLIYGDLDEDGDLDLVVTYSGSYAKFYRNEFDKHGHWVRFRLLDPELQRDAIGASILVECSNKTFQGVVMPSSSYLASHDPRVHIGLGDTEQINRVIVQWPDGPIETSREEFLISDVNRDVTLRRGAGKLLGVSDD